MSSMPLLSLGAMAVLFCRMRTFPIWLNVATGEPRRRRDSMRLLAPARTDRAYRCVLQNEGF